MEKSYQPHELDCSDIGVVNYTKPLPLATTERLATISFDSFAMPATPLIIRFEVRYQDGSTRYYVRPIIVDSQVSHLSMDLKSQKVGRSGLAFLKNLDEDPAAELFYLVDTSILAVDFNNLNKAISELSTSPEGEINIAASIGSEDGLPLEIARLVQSGNSRLVYRTDKDGKGMSGYPVKVSSKASSVYLADLDGDGNREIVSNALEVYRANGLPFEGWERELDFAPTLEVTDWHLQVSIGDLDGDGIQEMIFAGVARPQRPTGSILFVVDYDGRLRWVKQYKTHLMPTAKLVDIDGDGQLEVVGMFENLRLDIIKGDGRSLAGFPRYLNVSDDGNDAIDSRVWRC